ncbi:MAG: hypothetical protein EBU46_00925 [Nitrosomonadaceae bacterium]|nr:hypothetical protein [Nitrosomonadaceae bacterium]
MNGPESLIKFAVNQAVGYINHDKLDPQAALVKAAKELELNPNFIKRASEALNVALTYNHLKKAKDKAADFPIIDAAKVAEEIFGVVEKTTNTKKAEQFSSNQYPETTAKFARYLHDPRYKAAHAAISGATINTKYAMSEVGLYEKAAKYLKTLKLAAENAAVEKVGAEMKANRMFCNLLGEFAKAAEYRTPFNEFESQVFAKHGEASSDYVELIYKHAKLTEPRGSHDANRVVKDFCKEAELFDAFINQAATLKEVVKTAEEATHNYEFEKSFVEDIYKQAHTEKTANVVDELNAIDHVTNQRAKVKKQLDATKDPVITRMNTKIASELDVEEERIKKAFSFIDSVPVLKDINKGGDSGITSNSDPEMRKRKLMLQELATTDPILKKVEPQRLVDAYSQMLHIAPEMSQEKEIVRSTLRQMSAAQSLGPHEGQQLMEANNEMLKQRQLMQNRPASGPKPA